MERGPYTASNPRQVLKIVRGSDPAHETVREVDQSPVVASAVFEPANNGSAAAANTRTSGAARGSGNPKRSQTQRAGGVKGFSGSRTHALAATNGAIHSSDRTSLSHVTLYSSVLWCKMRPETFFSCSHVVIVVCLHLYTVYSVPPCAPRAVCGAARRAAPS